jgi:hypothetical protein
MKNLSRNIFILLILSMLIGTSCSSMKKNSCGCPSKKGMVGY